MPRHVRIGGSRVTAVVLAALAAGTLAAGLTGSALATQVLPVAPGCADARSAYEKAQRDAVDPAGPGERRDGTVITPEEAGFKKAARDQATNPNGAQGAKTTPTEQDKIDAADEAAIDPAGPGTVRDGREITPAERDNIEAKKQAADKACRGLAGEQGRPGDRGADGIDAQVILAPNLCASALVRPDTDQLVKVLVLIPCPLKAPAPPAARPEPGDRVTIIDRTRPAPAPDTVESDLPVTH